MEKSGTKPLIAIACGGTGGHFFPGLAVAEALQQRGCDIVLMISAKEVDQHGVKSAYAMDVVTLPAVALQAKDLPGFAPAFWHSCRISLREFRRRRPRAVLAMGGFTAAPPVLAAKTIRVPAFLHEANSIPGRANRWLSPLVDQAFLGFPSAAARLHTRAVRVTGTPVRPQFRPIEPSACKIALSLDMKRPVLLVMGGSQGASAINELVCQAIPALIRGRDDWQFIHLTGSRDLEKVRAFYHEQRLRAVVLPFLTEMELALGAASVAISRAGASALAEIAAMQVPSILLPYPSAIDNHQFYNARAFLQTGAARQLDQASADPENLARVVNGMAADEKLCARMREALRQWHFPRAAAEIADSILQRIGVEAVPATVETDEADLDSFLPPRQNFQLPTSKWRPR